jgi:alpha,alpha-trehalase
MQQSLDFFCSNLFRDVQMNALFKDSKTFADAQPKESYEAAIHAYELTKNTAGFDLNAFVDKHFVLPDVLPSIPQMQKNHIFDYISHQWKALARKPDGFLNSSLIPLKHPYIVPGGRFREIYYWDSYFTSLGLVLSGEIDMVKSMLENFFDIQERVGLIPNGNRSYYHTRSQPPVLTLLLQLVLKDDQSTLVDSSNAFFMKGLAAIEKEYQGWMDGETILSDSQPSYRRVVKIDEFCLNRYYDDAFTPRPESFREDVALAAHLPLAERGAFYRSIRAACESGWDFSSRWLKDGKTLASIHTTDIIPVDLNAFLYKAEYDLATYYSALNDTQKALEYSQRAKRRAQAINTYLWNANTNWYFDYDFSAKQAKTVYSLAALVPLFTGLCSRTQADGLHSGLLKYFFKKGGLITSTIYSGQQWDGPNGWAPLNYMACKGLLDYGFSTSAEKIMRAWMTTVDTHFVSTGTMMEKYDLVHPHLAASGGEYDVQEGFGWTNGVTLAFNEMLKRIQ